MIKIKKSLNSAEQNENIRLYVTLRSGDFMKILARVTTALILINLSSHSSFAIQPSPKPKNSIAPCIKTNPNPKPGKVDCKVTAGSIRFVHGSVDSESTDPCKFRCTVSYDQVTFTCDLPKSGACTDNKKCLPPAFENEYNKKCPEILEFDVSVSLSSIAPRNCNNESISDSDCQAHLPPAPKALGLCYCPECLPAPPSDGGSTY